MQSMRIGINAISGNLCSGARSYLLNLLPALVKHRPEWDFVVWHNERDDFLAKIVQDHYKTIPVLATTCDNPLKRLVFE